jgi:hypothetical protein
VANSTLFNNGTNVGIGTTNPSAKLDVNGSFASNSGSIRQIVKDYSVPAATYVPIYVSDSSTSITSSYVYRVTLTTTGTGTVSGAVYVVAYNGTNWVSNFVSGAGTTSNHPLMRINGTTLEAYHSHTSTYPMRIMVETFGTGNANSSLTFFGLEGGMTNLNGSIGIGSTIPSYTLDVTGTGRFTQPLIIGAPTAASHAATKSYVDSVASSAAGGGVGAGTSGQTLRHNGTNWVANSTLFNNGTNVGIGTSNPLAKLHLYQGAPSGATSIYPGTQLVLDSSGNNFINFRNPADNGSWQGLVFTDNNHGAYIAFQGWNGAVPADSLSLGTYQDIYFQTGGSGTVGGKNTVMTIKQSGNVGIGSTAPAYKLDVAGTGQFTQPVIVGTPTAANHAVTKGYFDSAIGDPVGAGTSGQTLRHNGTNWIANSTLYNNGTNVGIGTSNPGTKLTVIGDLSGSALLGQGFNNIKSNGGFESGTIVNGGWSGAGVVTSSYAHSGAYSLRMNAGTSHCNEYVYEDFDAKANTIYSVSGWIKTISETAGADIFISEGSGTGCSEWTRMGTSGVSGTNDWTKKNIDGWNSQSCLKVRIGFTKQYCDSSGDSYFDDLMVTEGYSPKSFYPKPIVDSYNGNQFVLGGNVGIGTTAPSYKLDVTGTGQFTQPVIVGSPTATNHAATKSYVDSVASSAAGGGVGTGTSGQTLMHNGTNWVANSNLFNNGTNVGVGTTAPAEKLNVSTGNITIDYGYYLGSQYAGGSVRPIIGTINPHGFTYIRAADNDTGDGIQFQAYGGAALTTILNNGNVGIGNIIPSASLDILSKLKFTSGGTIYNTDSGRWLDMTGTLGESLKVSSDLYSTAGELKTDGTGINYMLGSLGIGTTTPSVKLDIISTGFTAIPPLGSNGGILSVKPANTLGLLMGVQSGGAAWLQSQRVDGSATAYNLLLQPSGGNVGIGTTDPGAYKLYVNGSAYVNGSLTMADGANLSMPSSQLTVNKLTVNTIDPLYNIKGTNYSSFAASIVGGVKEEVTGKIKIDTKVNDEYQAIIDFDKQKSGSDLWVWRSVIDFNKDNVEAIITPYGGFANVYYSISENKFIFHSNQPVEVSYRLIAKRFDWRQWPTKAKNQKEKAGFILK